jgi:hypothetical protein
MKWRRLTINSRLKCAVCAPSTPKRLKSVNLSKRILPASKVRHLRRSRLPQAWLRPPYVPGLRCQWQPRPRLLPTPVLPLPRMRRPISPRSPGLRLLLVLLQSPAVLLPVPRLLGRVPLPPSTAAVLPRRCSDPNQPMRRKSVFTNINVGFPPLPSRI